MRSLVFLFASVTVMGLAYWAYAENYRTQDALKQAASLQREIGAARETKSVLEAEWAYLNRPERLRDLVELNFLELQLLPISHLHFGDIDDIVEPEVIPEFNLDDVIRSVLLTGVIEGEAE